MEKHTLTHAIYSVECNHAAVEITNCVICERRLDPPNPFRDHVHTCGKRCWKRLLEAQRSAPEPKQATADRP